MPATIQTRNAEDIHAVELALKYKMRFDPYVFMSTKPFAKWENYIFHGAALM
jgi:hypothetical protein